MILWLTIVVGGATLVAAVALWRRHSSRTLDGVGDSAPGDSRRGSALSAGSLLAPGAAVVQKVRGSVTSLVQAVSSSGSRLSEAVAVSGTRMSEVARSSGTTVTGLVRSAWHRVVARRRSADLAQDIRTWALKSHLSERRQVRRNPPEDAAAFSEWLASLPAEQLELFTQRIADVVAAWGIDLAWVVGQELNRAPAVQHAVEESVLLHCMAYWHASRAQDDIRAFATYRAWQRDLCSDRQKTVNQRLYARLIEKGLLTAPAPDVLLASEDRRRDFVVQALRQASEADVAAFSSTLQEIEGADGAGAPKPSAPSTPAPAAPRRKRLGIPTGRGTPTATDAGGKFENP
jgi:hypothetical protein